MCLHSPTSMSVSYTNLTMISSSPLTDWSPSPFLDLFRPVTGKFSRHFVARLGLKNWINLIVSTVNKIERENRVIRTTIGEEIPYDMLFLFPGEQFGPPALLPDVNKEDECKAYVEKSFGKLSAEQKEVIDEEDIGDQPVNVFYINSERDTIDCLVKLTYGIRSNPKYLLVLYGDVMEMYCSLFGLLEWGIPGANMLVIMEEPPSPDNNIFTDAAVMETILRCIEEEGITMLAGYTLRSWQVKDIDLLTSKPEPHIVSLTYMPQSKPQQIYVNSDREAPNNIVSLEAWSPKGFTFVCMALFCFTQRSLDKHLRYAICDAGLILNHRIVIDRMGTTNDPCIRAGGPAAMETKRNARGKQQLCSREFGSKLAKTMRRIWDPLERDRVYISSIPQPSQIDPSSFEQDYQASTYEAHPVQQSWGVEPTHRSRMASAIRAALGSYLKYSAIHTSYVLPIRVYCTLPGGWYFYLVHRPLEMRKTSEEYRFGKCERGKGPYVRLAFSTGRLLDYICILSETPQPKRAIQQLYGHHIDTMGPVKGSKDILATILRPEVMARTMSRRLGDGSSSDLEILFGFPSGILVSTVEKVLSQNGWQNLTQAQLNALRAEFFNSPHQKRIEEILKSYFDAHGLNLPPEQVRMYLKALLHFAAS